MVGGAYGPYIHTGATLHGNQVGAREFHSRNEYVLLLLESGIADLTGHQSGRLVAPAAVLLQPAGDCQVTMPGGCTGRLLRFDAVHQPLHHYRSGRAFTHADAQVQPEARAIWGVDLPVVLPAQLVDSCAACIRMCTNTWWRGDIEYVRANNRLGAWLIELVAYLTFGDARREAGWLARCRHLAETNLAAAGIGVGELAAAWGVSRQHFTRRFVADHGITPAQFLDDLRMERARHLLAATDQKVAAVARAAGYRSVSTFCHRFKIATGMTPRDWRRQSMHLDE